MHATCPTLNQPSFDYRYNILWSVELMSYLIMHFPPTSYYLLSLSSPNIFLSISFLNTLKPVFF